ncbi:NUDIX hydrolase [Halosolutus halophilus]|uniref:NUDIX hydrolase n=1 Tax=Halosolutus halophilus TaxID=1552990 RepID=UPI002234F3DA|nr:NUDIX hydrolase [Halosolutus halophilus]
MDQPAHASVRGLIENEGRVLLIKQRTPDGSDVWEVPGGRALIGEDPRDAVVREVREETSLEITVGDPIDVYSYTWDGRAKGVVATVFECEVVDGTVDISNTPEDESIIGFDWVTRTRVDSLPMLPELREIITDQ